MGLEDYLKGTGGTKDGASSIPSDVISRLRELGSSYDDVHRKLITIGAEIGADPELTVYRKKWHDAIRGFTDSNCLAKALVDMASPDAKKSKNTAPMIQAILGGSFFDAGKLILKLGLTPAEIDDIEVFLKDKNLILKDASATLAMISGRNFDDPSNALDYCKNQLLSNERVMSLISSFVGKQTP